jgi:cytochrome oxidase Cu insertion factor (SCO1/SenC/PrrC family)
MKSVIAGIYMLIMCSAAFGADRTPVAKATDKGEFSLEMVSNEKELRNGTNALDFVVRDKKGKGIERAELTVTPWLPAMGHGVWDKPMVKERGAGKYSIQNIVTTMDGRWELKIYVRKGPVKDLAVFSFDVAGKGPATRKEADLPKGKYSRSVQYYSIPSVSLLNQDGKKVNLRELVDSGKPVIFDFIYTTCTTICPVLSASFTNLRRELGEEAGKVQLISISIDPENGKDEEISVALQGGQGVGFSYRQPGGHQQGTEITRRQHRGQDVP